MQRLAAAAMRVVWSTDERFVKPTLVSILSLLEHASRNVAVHVMGHRLSGAALDLLGRVEDAYPGTTFEHIPIEDGMIHAEDWPSDYYPPVAMARLLLPRFFDAGRVLHLDSDTFVLDDVAPLFDIPMDGKLIAAARDARTMEMDMWRDADTDELARDTAAVMNGHPTTDYVNSGVILLDCGEIIRSGLDAWMVRLMEVGKTCPTIDQDVLNIVFKGRVEIVGNEWNTHILTYVDIERRHQEWQWMRRYLTCSPRILHFTGLGPKPWKPVEMRYFEDPPPSGRIRPRRDPLPPHRQQAAREGARRRRRRDGGVRLPVPMLNRAANPHKFIREQISLPHALIRN